jgi:hypothetical protein
VTIRTFTLRLDGSMFVQTALRAADRLPIVRKVSSVPSPLAMNSCAATHTPLCLEISVHAAGMAGNRMHAVPIFYPVEG